MPAEAHQQLASLNKLPYSRTHYVYDEYTGPDRVAGTVHNTKAGDGYSIRTVLDTTAKLSIVSNRLELLQGPLDRGDPGLLYPALPRVKGRYVVAKFHRDTTSGEFGLGWGKTGQGAPTNGLLPLGSFFKTYDQIGGGYGPTCVTGITAFTEYEIAVVLRMAGAQYFMKVGSEWRLIWVSVRNVDNPVRPYIQGYSTASGGPFSVDYLYVPHRLWMVSPVASDSFNRANGALGSTDGAGHAESTGLGSGGAGLAWNIRQGTWGITTNVACPLTVVDTKAIATIDAGSPNHIMMANTTRTGGNVGVVVRWADASNFVWGFHDGTNLKLYKRLAGVDSEVGTVVVTYVAGALMELTCNGTAFVLGYGTADKSVVATITDGGLQTGVHCGLFGSATTMSLDNAIAYRYRGHAVPMM